MSWPRTCFPTYTDTKTPDTPGLEFSSNDATTIGIAGVLGAFKKTTVLDAVFCWSGRVFSILDLEGIIFDDEDMDSM